MRKLESTMAVGLVLAAGCATGPERSTTPVEDPEAETALLERAAEELPCARADTHVGKLSNDEYLAWGCDREARYRVTCGGLGVCMALQPGERETVTTAASIDLRCKKVQLSVRQADEGRFIAQGCGKTAAYQTACSSVPQGCAEQGKTPDECGQECTATLTPP
jgi:hypothetical protein